MAAVAFSDGNLKQKGITFEREVVVWASPATMDSADTIILPTITGLSPVMISAWDSNDGDACTATISGQVVTVDAGGAATNSVYILMFTYI